METRPSDFSVVSKGYCFLCLDKISPFVDVSPSSVKSFQDISRYLKLDMRKVFTQEGHVPTNLLAKVEKSRLKVDLCDECASITENISNQCQRLYKLKMEIESGLGSIHGKMLEADEAGRTEEFRKVMCPESDSGIGGWMEVLDVLRMETIRKCSRKIKTASPQIPIHRLTSREIRKRTFRILKEAETTPELTLDLGLNNGVKREEEDCAENWELEDDNHDDSPFDDNFDGYADGFTSTGVKDVDRPAHGLVTNITAIPKGDRSGRKWSINPETGKYKCQLCSMEYASYQGVYLHFDSTHRKVRFKCQICGKEFTRKWDYKIHHESVHLGIRFQCQVCKKILSSKNSLRRHRSRCAIKA